MTRLYLVGGVVVALIAVGGFLYLRGGSDQRQRDALQDAVDYRTTRERMDDATLGDRTLDDIVDRLRRYAE